MPFPRSVKKVSMGEMGGRGKLSSLEEAFASAWASETGIDREAAFRRVCVAAGVDAAEGVRLRGRVRVVGRMNELKDGIIRASRVSWRQVCEDAKRVLHDLALGEDVSPSVRSGAARAILDSAAKGGFLEQTRDDEVRTVDHVDDAALRLTAS